jgi:hypothetical protein
VPKLRLQGISTLEYDNAFLPEFRETSTLASLAHR